MELNFDNYKIGSEITLDDTPINNLKYQSYQNVERPKIYNRFNWFRDIPQFSMNIPVNSKQKVSSNQMVQFFVNKGLTYNQSRGLVGNLLHESGGGIYNIVQGGKRGELKIDGKTGYGLAQWTSKDRQTRLYNFTKTTRPTAQQQLNFVWWELNNTHKHALKALKNTSTIEEATESIMKNYEHPNPRLANLKRRIQYAKQI